MCRATQPTLPTRGHTNISDPQPRQANPGIACWFRNRGAGQRQGQKTLVAPWTPTGRRHLARLEALQTGFGSSPTHLIGDVVLGLLWR